AAPPRLAGGRARALSRAAAAHAAARGGADRTTAHALRRGRGRDPDGLHQRAGAGALPDRVEPLRPVRSRAARPARLRAPVAVRVLGARGLPRADDDAAMVAARHARLSRPPHRPGPGGPNPRPTPSR